jgi:hypothetical protein
MMARAEERRRAAWGCIRDVAGFTTHDLMDATGHSIEWCRKTIRHWRAEGMISEHGRAETGQMRYRALPEAEDRETTFGRERQTPEFAMWRMMRRLRRFTPDDVHLVANTEERPLSLRDVQQYCSLLAEAGVIDCVRRKRFGRAPARYVLKGQPGPFPPRLMRVPALYDPNKEQFQVLSGRVRV